MTDLDQKFDPPTRDQLAGEIGGVALAENGNPDHGPYIMFRAVCGAEGYYCSASFRDPVGYGGGATPREAMRSLARDLRAIASRVENAAADDEDALLPGERVCRACDGDGILMADANTPSNERVTRDSRRCTYCRGTGKVSA